jgi:hypothetical protein
MTLPKPDDDLLAALDQFTNTVYWLRSRTPITAAQALAEAINDAASDDASETVDLRTAIARLLDHHDDAAIATALAVALVRWTAGLCAEHNASNPFQPAATRPL